MSKKTSEFILNVGMGKFCIEKFILLLVLKDGQDLRMQRMEIRDLFEEEKESEWARNYEKFGGLSYGQLSLEWLAEYKKNKDIKFFMPGFVIL